MKRLISWLKREHYLPYCSYVWDGLFGEETRRLLVRLNILNYDRQNSIASEFYFMRENFRVSSCGDSYLAIGEFGNSYEMTSSQMKVLTFNVEQFGLHLAKILAISSSISSLGYGCDGLFLGNKILSKGYRIFLKISSRNFLQYIKPLVGEFAPVVIELGNSDNEIEKYVSECGGKCIAIENLISLSHKGFNVIKELSDFLGNQRKTNNSQAYYSWIGTKLPVPEMPSIKLLSMDLISPSEVKIKYGEYSIRVHYSDISIFKSNDLSEISFAWKVICACALKRELVGINKKNLPRYIGRLNAKFRDFFGFDDTAFSCIDGELRNNFLISAKEYLSTRSHSEVFNGNDTNIDGDFLYPSI